MEIGARVIYDQDGDVICISGEREGSVLPRKEIIELNFVDLNYGDINYNTHRIASIDPITKQPVLESIEVPLTPDQQRIKELEDQLLLMADANTGGIL